MEKEDSLNSLSGECDNSSCATFSKIDCDCHDNNNNNDLKVAENGDTTNSAGSNQESCDNLNNSILNEGLKRNVSPKFVGIDNLIKENANQVNLFRKWATEKQWKRFHSNHYDWWAFPIDVPSSFGVKYTIFDFEINIMKQDYNFMNNLRDGLRLLSQSWGWSLRDETWIPVCELDDKLAQKWQHWGVRLFKAQKSAVLFGCREEANSLRLLGNILLDQGEELRYNSRDFSSYFRSQESVLGTLET